MKAAIKTLDSKDAGSVDLSQSYFRLRAACRYFAACNSLSTK